MAKNLFVGSLPFSTTEATLRELFAGSGAVLSATLITDKFTGQSRGFGFVEMGTEEEAKSAIEKLNGHQIDGHAIVVKEASPKPTYTNGRAGGRRPFGNRPPRRF
jgi:RNA recognition motif-containing protein